MPALGADDDHDLAGGRRLDGPQRLLGLLVQQHAEAAPGAAGRPRRGCRPARPRPGTWPDATAWRPPAPSYAIGPAPSRRARRATASRTAPRPTARSRRHPPRSSSRPPASPRSPLGSACTTTSRGAAPARRSTELTSTSRWSLPLHRGDRTVPAAAAAVDEHDLLAGAAAGSRWRRAGPPARRRSDPAGHQPRRSGTHEHRRAHRTPGAQRWLKASRSRLKKPCCWPVTDADVRAVLAAERGQLAQQLLLLGVEPGRRHDLDVHDELAAARRRAGG